MAPPYRAIIDSNCLADLAYWTRTNRRIAIRIYKLIDAVLRDPLRGVGKPEALRGELSEKWSRRIDHEHRLVYEVKEGSVVFLSARYHYSR